MDLAQMLFILFLIAAILHLGQVFIYGFKEHNRPTVLFGVVFLFLAFALEKGEDWVNWAAIIVPLTGFVALLTGFSESLKPNLLNYFLILLNLVLTLLSVMHMIS